MVVLAAAVVGGGYYVVSSGAIGKVIALMSSAPHGRSYAARVVDGLQDTPECATYRADILAYRSEPHSEAVTIAVDKIFHDGVAAGCKRSDLID